MKLRHLWTMSVGALLSVTLSASAQQPGFSFIDLPIVMTAYVEAAIDMHAAYETCAPADKRPGEWEQGSALLMESLKGAGLSASVAAALETRLAAPVVPFVGDCAGEQLMLYSGVPAGTSWPDYHRGVLGVNGIKIVEPGVQDARLDAVRAVVEDTLPRQKRMLVCISLFDPQNFLAAYTDWNKLVAQAAEALIAEGFGQDKYGSFLDGAQSRLLYQPPSDRAVAAADCVANQDWLDRFSTFAWYSFAGDVEAALKGGQP
ncbi:MAG: hypothetical protein KF849_17670 [Rhizobiaceae bacterium]|nr:hypothetical protein [Rhizobiaceae bacterium]